MVFLGKEYSAPLTYTEMATLCLLQNVDVFKLPSGDYKMFFPDWCMYEKNIIFSKSQYTFESLLAELKASGWTVESIDENPEGARCCFYETYDIIYDTLVEMAAKKGINCYFGEDINHNHPNFHFYYGLVKSYALGIEEPYFPPYVESGDASPALPNAERAFICYNFIPSNNEPTGDIGYHIAPILCLEAEVTPDGNYRIICDDKKMQRHLLNYCSMPAYRIYGVQLPSSGYYEALHIQGRRYEKLQGKLIPAKCSVVGKRADGNLLLEANLEYPECFPYIDERPYFSFWYQEDLLERLEQEAKSL